MAHATDTSSSSERTVKAAEKAAQKGAEQAGTAGYAMLIFRLARVTGFRVTRALASLEMRTNEFAVLHYLHRAGPLSQQELGGALGINPSNLVGLLDALEADGLILRPRDPADRRRHLVGLTPAGHRRLGQAKRAVAQAEHELLAPLGPVERQQLYGFLERLAGHSCGPGRSC